MWTLAEASVECRVMSGATAAASKARDTEEREGAWSGDGHAEVNAVAAIEQAIFNPINADAAISLRRADIESRCDNRSVRDEVSMSGIVQNFNQATTGN